MHLFDLLCQFLLTLFRFVFYSTPLVLNSMQHKCGWMHMCVFIDVLLLKICPVDYFDIYLAGKQLWLHQQAPPHTHTHTELIIFMSSKVLCLCTLLEYYWFSRLSSRHSRINVSYFWTGMDCIMAYVAVNMFLCILYTWQRMCHGGMWGLLHTMHNLGGGGGEKQNNNVHSLHISVCTKKIRVK